MGHCLAASVLSIEKLLNASALFLVVITEIFFISTTNHRFYDYCK
jgi:hypothetical protein